MMAWLYALYCFDYSWSLHGVPLPARVRELEEGWAFFLGEGQPSQRRAGRALPVRGDLLRNMQSGGPPSARCGGGRFVPSSSSTPLR